MGHTLHIFIAFVCIIACQNNAHAHKYLVGLGKADITGPVADIQLMGYANPSQIGAGLHTRLFARTIIVADLSTPQQRFAFVNLDACMAAQAVTFTVIQRLKDRFGPDLYTEQNVILSGTHTHSGPAGYLQYVVYDITGLGFVPQTFEALVNGIVNSISRAHDNLQPGQLSLAIGELLEANINRSPTAYVQNPKEERELYEYDIDKEMTLLVAEDTDAVPRGAFSWFPVHGTSMNNTNTLVNGDNKGAAAQFMEKWALQQHFGALNSSTSGEFVAAFCQANVGDTSPNTLGPVCMDTGEPCDAVHSTCGGRVEQCIGRGPAWPNHFESTKIIAQKQAEKAQNLVLNKFGAPKDKKMRISGSIEFRHMFLDMRNIEIEASNFTRAGHTCLPAMGFAFAAGTTDGPGAFDFKQSDTNGTLFWRIVRDFIHMPSTAQTACHAPKPILLDVGEMHFPYEWVPYIVEIQIVRVGQLVILAVPGEFSTMAGRRLKKAVDDILRPIWGSSDEDMELHYVIAGLSNTYSSYITTFEEYQAQRYEAAFTLFGPHTLDAYIQEFRRLARAMVDKQPTEPGPDPPNMLSQQWSLVAGVVADGVPFGVSFGDVVAGKDVIIGSGVRGDEGSSKDLKHDSGISSLGPGDEVAVQFHSACPRNDLRSDDTYLTVERLVEESSEHHSCESLWESVKYWLFGAGKASEEISEPIASNGTKWEVVHTDNDWETKFYWTRHEHFSTYSFATIVWNIPNDVMPGLYRIRHFGNYKHFLGEIHPFEGSSSVFRVDNERKEFDESSSNASLWGILLVRLGRRAGGILSARF